MKATCTHVARAYDVENGDHHRRCDRPIGHDGMHHPATLVEPSTIATQVAEVKRRFADLLRAVAQTIDKRDGYVYPTRVAEVDDTGTGWLKGKGIDASPVTLKSMPGFTIVATTELEEVLAWVHEAESGDVEWSEELTDAYGYLRERVNASR